MNGVLVIDKPEGITSFDVVRDVRRHLKTKKVGHTGTLDPMATGVLPICLGEATKIATFLTEGDKTYETTVRLGAATDTQDRTGKIIAERPWQGVTREQVEALLPRFRGEIEQIPPMYSAIRVDGQRLYDIARAGGEVEREARRITIFENALLTFTPPELTLRVHCSKGTYIRTLGHDLGAALGCHAHLSALRRTVSASFRLDQSVTLDALKSSPPAEIEQRLVSCREALSFLPELVVEEGRPRKKVLTGMRLTVEDLPALEKVAPGAKLRISTPEGVLLAVGEWKDGALHYLRVLAVP